MCFVADAELGTDVVKKHGRPEKESGMTITEKIVEIAALRQELASCLKREGDLRRTLSRLAVIVEFRLVHQEDSRDFRNALNDAWRLVDPNGELRAQHRGTDGTSDAD